MAETNPGEIDRRQLVITSSVAALTYSAGLASASAEDTNEALAASETTASIHLKVNGVSRAVTVDTRTSLLDALRERIGLTGTKKGCDHGQCGACTVILNGRRVNSCLTLAVMHDGDEITTIEGLGTPANLHPMQAAFIKHDGYQCGYCTSGQICSSVAMLQELKSGSPSHVSDSLTDTVKPTRRELSERMSGNICRCGAYSNIVAAIAEVGGIEI